MCSIPDVKFFIDGDIQVRIVLIRDGRVKRSVIELFNRRTLEMAAFQSHTLDDIITKINYIISKTESCVEKSDKDAEGLNKCYLYEDEVDLAQSSNRKPLVKYIQADNLYNIKYLWNDIVLTKSDLQALYKAQKIMNEWDCSNKMKN